MLAPQYSLQVYMHGAWSVRVRRLRTIIVNPSRVERSMQTACGGHSNGSSDRYHCWLARSPANRQICSHTQTNSEWEILDGGSGRQLAFIAWAHSDDLVTVCEALASSHSSNMHGQRVCEGGYSHWTTAPCNAQTLQCPLLS